MVRGLNAAQWHSAEDADTLAAQLAEAVADNLAEALAKHTRASLVLSGGSTPLPFFKQLSQVDLDWSNVDVTLADERWVPSGDPDSNADFVAEHFLQGHAKAANFVNLYQDSDTPEAALPNVERELEKLAQPFSVVILGMGSDGHTASLFPDTAGLSEALDLNNMANVAILRPATVPQTRISLTRRALLNSGHRYLHITGEQKRTVLENALSAGADNPLPIASFFEQQVPPISVYWSP